MTKSINQMLVLADKFEKSGATKDFLDTKISSAILSVKLVQRKSANIMRHLEAMKANYSQKFDPMLEDDIVETLADANRILSRQVLSAISSIEYEVAKLSEAVMKRSDEKYEQENVETSVQEPKSDEDKFYSSIEGAFNKVDDDAHMSDITNFRSTIGAQPPTGNA